MSIRKYKTEAGASRAGRHYTAKWSHRIKPTFKVTQHPTDFCYALQVCLRSTGRFIFVSA